MLSRRHLRIKVLQTLYAFFQSGNDKLEAGEKMLLHSIDKLYEQYLYIMSFLVEVTDFGRIRIEEGKQKFFPTEEDLNPNTKFVDNKIISKIESNRDFRKRTEKLKINWSNEQEMIRRFYLEMKRSRSFKDYLNSSDSSLKHDKSFVENLLKLQVSDYQSLENYFEDKNIFWASDYFVAIWLVLKTIRSMNNNWNEFTELPVVFDFDDNGKNEDREYIIKLFHKVIIHNKYYEGLIDARTQNWEIERIAAMDMLILKMAITELLEFPSIPVKVTLNEYIEIAKLFSTPKSRIFINGILDKLIVDFSKDNKINKSGRGLMT